MQHLAGGVAYRTCATRAGVWLRLAVYAADLARHVTIAADQESLLHDRDVTVARQVFGNARQVRGNARKCLSIPIP